VRIHDELIERKRVIHQRCVEEESCGSHGVDTYVACESKRGAPAAKVPCTSLDVEPVLSIRGLEAATGGQRLHLLPDYELAMAASGIDRTPFEG
jgi:hypothetical protein